MRLGLVGARFRETLPLDRAARKYGHALSPSEPLDNAAAYSVRARLRTEERLWLAVRIAKRRHRLSAGRTPHFVDCFGRLGRRRGFGFGRRERNGRPESPDQRLIGLHVGGGLRALDVLFGESDAVELDLGLV